MKKFLLILYLIWTTAVFADFSADKATAEVGETIALNWSSSASSCTAFDDWSGSKSGSGSEEVQVAKLQWNVYGISCGGVSEWAYVWGIEASTTTSESSSTSGSSTSGSDTSSTSGSSTGSSSTSSSASTGGDLEEDDDSSETSSSGSFNLSFLSELSDFLGTFETSSSYSSSGESTGSSTGEGNYGSSSTSGSSADQTSTGSSSTSSSTSTAPSTGGDLEEDDDSSETSSSGSFDFSSFLGGLTGYLEETGGSSSNQTTTGSSTSTSSLSSGLITVIGTAYLANEDQQPQSAMVGTFIKHTIPNTNKNSTYTQQYPVSTVMGQETAFDYLCSEEYGLTTTVDDETVYGFRSRRCDYDYQTQEESCTSLSDLDTDGDGTLDINISDEPSLRTILEANGLSGENLEEKINAQKRVYKNISYSILDSGVVPSDFSGSADKYLFDLWSNLETNIDNDGDGQADLNITLPFYRPAVIDISPIGLSGETTINETISWIPDPLPILNLDTDGDGIADLNVVIDDYSDQFAEFLLLNFDSDYDGVPDLNIDEVDDDGLADTRIDETLDCQADFSIVDSAGHVAAANAVVELYGDEGQVLATTTTDENGDFFFENIRTETLYLLQIVADRGDKKVWYRKILVIPESVAETESRTYKQQAIALTSAPSVLFIDGPDMQTDEYGRTTTSSNTTSRSSFVQGNGTCMEPINSGYCVGGEFIQSHFDFEAGLEFEVTIVAKDINNLPLYLRWTSADGSEVKKYFDAPDENGYQTVKVMYQFLEEGCYEENNAAILEKDPDFTTDVMISTESETLFGGRSQGRSPWALCSVVEGGDYSSVEGLKDAFMLSNSDDHYWQYKGARGGDNRVIISLYNTDFSGYPTVDLGFIVNSISLNKGISNAIMNSEDIPNSVLEEQPSTGMTCNAGICTYQYNEFIYDFSGGDEDININIWRESDHHGGEVDAGEAVSGYLLYNDSFSRGEGGFFFMPPSSSLVIDIWFDVELTDPSKNLLIYWEDKSYSGNYNDQLPSRIYGQEVTFDYTEIRPLRHEYFVEGFICATSGVEEVCGDNLTRKVFVSFLPQTDVADPGDHEGSDHGPYFLYEMSTNDSYGWYVNGKPGFSEAYLEGETVTVEMRFPSELSEVSFHNSGWLSHDATYQVEITSADIGAQGARVYICMRNNDGYSIKKVSIGEDELDSCGWWSVPTSE